MLDLGAASRRPTLGLRSGPVGLERLPLAPVIAVGSAAILGALAVISIQIALGLALLGLLYAVYLQSRRAGITLLWVLWLLIPLLRRIFGLFTPFTEADPLSVVPFVATLLIGLLEVQRAGLGRRGRSIAALVAVGLGLGIPVGIVSDFSPFAFGLLAYGSAFGAFAIGHAEGEDGSEIPLLGTILLIAMPLLAAYGIYQYFFPLPSWDAQWLGSVDFGSVEATPQEGKIRIFSTLNSPAALGAMLAAAIVFALAVRRLTPGRLVLLVPLVVGLALTFGRSAWLGLLAALVVYALAVRGAGTRRLVIVLVACLVTVVLASGTNPTVRAFSERATSIGNLQSDVSFQQRLEFTQGILPGALAEPLGHGIGQAGLASRIGQSGRLSTFDNGYALLIYQFGPLGALLIVSAMGWVFVLAVRSVGAARSREVPATLLAILTLIAILEASGDALYGVTGAVFWYTAGFVVRSVEEKP